MEPQKLDLMQLPKQFCEGTAVATNKEYFTLALMVGAGAAAYAFAPANVKRFSQQLATAVASYEKEFGKIEGDWINGVPSPIQPLKK